LAALSIGQANGVAYAYLAFDRAPDDDHDVYFVMDDLGRLGRVWRETDPDNTDREIVIRDLLDGQYSNPVRVVSFNTAEGWSRDASNDIADALRRRCDLEGREPPSSVENFLDRFDDHDRSQLRLRLA
jgi:hypothetical protein